MEYLIRHRKIMKVLGQWEHKTHFIQNRKISYPMIYLEEEKEALDKYSEWRHVRINRLIYPEAPDDMLDKKYRSLMKVIHSAQDNTPH
jgi:hypothetical protein